MDGDPLAASAVVADGADEVVRGSGVEDEVKWAHSLGRAEAQTVRRVTVVVLLFRHLGHGVCSCPAESCNCNRI